MLVLVTGATGFVGQNTIPELIKRGHSIIALARNESKAKTFDWYKRVKFIVHDIHSKPFLTLEKIGNPDAMLHLAWSGLPDYMSLFHYEKNLIADYLFLKSIVEQNMGHILVTGTCFEYGLQNGCLSVDLETRPEIPYALAKDTLRKFLQSLKKTRPFKFQWARLFYMYGPGQHPKSILSQLDSAIKSGDTFFNMSKGEQLRDYLPVSEVAVQLCDLIDKYNKSGIFNICSGHPISVRTLVEQHLAERNVSLKLNFGHFPYNDYEPLAFWGQKNVTEKK